MSTADEVNSSCPADAALDLATEMLYRFLAALLSEPRTAGWQLVLDPASQTLAVEAAQLLREEGSAGTPQLGYGELPADELDLTSVLSALHTKDVDFAAEYARVFGLVSCRECPPYETEFHPNEDTFFRSQQMADAAGFYRAFGVQPGAASRERPDQLTLELEFAAFLLLKQRLATPLDAENDAVKSPETQLCMAARAAFVRDHLNWWLPSFSLALRRKAECGLYEGAGRLLAALLPIERARLGVQAPSLPILEPRSAESEGECTGCAAMTS